MVRQTLLESVMWKMRSWDEIKSASLFTLYNYANIIMFVVFLAVAIYQAKSKIEAAKALPRIRALRAPEFPPVEELEGFDWKATEPEKYRPLKPKYHLTMDDHSALESLEPTDLLLMDKNYHDRINYRRKILQQHHDIVVAVNSESRIAPAVFEMYTFLMGTYLPIRYPSMFKIHQTEYESGKEFVLQNIITSEILPAEPKQSVTNTITLLETLCKQLDEDFLLLLPEEHLEKGEPKYVLEAYSCVCPSGFNPREKLGLRLKDIHGPVPGYEQKLEGSMDRFFSKLEVGKYVKRVNWSVTVGTDLYAAGEGTNHAHEGDELTEIDEFDVDQTFLRCERQTLYRLPQSEAIVFAFKTYRYPIKEIKDEGSGEELAQAIDGLKGGSVPQMHFYKRGIVWGEAVKRYLRN